MALNELTYDRAEARTRWPLLLGDWITLLLFVFIGQRDHNMAVVGALPSLGTTTLALAIPWTVTAFLLGILRLQSGMDWRHWLGRVLNAWLVAAPLGLVLRALYRGQNSVSLPFMMVILGLGGLFILAWRTLAFYLLRRQPAVPGA